MRSTKALTTCALFAALIAVCSQISIPLEPVPINLALFAVELCGALLAPQYAALSVGAWMLLGLCGLPVFANFKGGPSALFGMTGGYIIGYIFAAVIIAVLAVKVGKQFWQLCLWMVLGVLACYAFGTVWFMVLTGRTLAASLSLCVLPFLPGDAVKIFLAAFLAKRLEKPMQKVLAL